MIQNLSLLQTAISSFEVLSLKYKSGQGVVSKREIEPLAIYFEQGEWKLVAYCRLRKEHRTFLFSRIHSLDSTNKSFPPNQFSLEDYFRK